jgi:hypothetical protein
MTATKLGIVGVIASALAACAGARTAQAQPLRDRAGAYSVEVLVDGAPAPTFQHAHQSYVMGSLGARYTLRVVNRSGQRVEAVVSVDGRDVLDGRAADMRKRGYLVPAWGSVEIDGWRLSQRQVAAFRFASVRDSYAARMGNARNVGVIGVAVFPERYVPPPPPVYVPWDRERSSGAPAREESTEAQSAPSASADARGGAARRAPSPSARPGLGTEFGERVHSEVREVTFVRAHASRPAAMLGVRYDDREGLYAAGVDVDGYGVVDEATLRATASPFPQRRYATPPVGWRR